MDCNEVREGRMCMDLANVKKLLQARVLTGSELLHRQIDSCCGSDMMSDVLAFTKRNTLLCIVHAHKTSFLNTQLKGLSLI